MPKEKKTAEPTKIEWLKVNPQTINREIFQRARENVKQEKLRKFIQEAFLKFDANPEKYPEFESMIPDKTWIVDTITNIKKHASDYGGHCADWIEQALIWAQMLSNGDTWESLCNEKDFSTWYRVITWKKGEPRIVGGSTHGGNNCEASHIHGYCYTDSSTPGNVVPVVIRYV